ncbi:MAG: hypothetical protein J4428_00100 [Candidatus Aenigmarchaeota archaeon]|nr:hypothetical protein [Candidatus Aenigmarchaeota archaeon]
MLAPKTVGTHVHYGDYRTLEFMSPSSHKLPWTLDLDTTAKYLASSLERGRYGAGYPKPGDAAVQYYLIGVGRQGKRIARAIEPHLRDIVGEHRKGTVDYIGTADPKNGDYPEIPNRLGRYPIIVPVDDNFRPQGLVESGLTLTFNSVVDELRKRRLRENSLAMMASVIGGGSLDLGEGEAASPYYHATLATPPDMVPMVEWIFDSFYGLVYRGLGQGSYKNEGHQFSLRDLPYYSPVIITIGDSGSYWGRKLTSDLYKRKKHGKNLLGHILLICAEIADLRGDHNKVPIVREMRYVDDGVNERLKPYLETLYDSEPLTVFDSRGVETRGRTLDFKALSQRPSMSISEPLLFDDALVTGATLKESRHIFRDCGINTKPSVICDFSGKADHEELIAPITIRNRYMHTANT